MLKLKLLLNSLLFCHFLIFLAESQTTNIEIDPAITEIEQQTSIDSKPPTTTSTTTKTTSTTKTTTLKPVVLDSTHIKLSPSVVLVWEKCGLEVRTQITQVFQSLNLKNNITLSFDPSINVLILQVSHLGTVVKKQITKLPESGAEILFIMFNEPGRLNVYLDCPSVSRTMLVIDLEDLSEMEYLELFFNTKAFDSLSNAMETYRCKNSLTILPGRYEIFADFILFA
jgi:hypothetical protein